MLEMASLCYQYRLYPLIVRQYQKGVNLKARAGPFQVCSDGGIELLPRPEGAGGRFMVIHHELDEKDDGKHFELMEDKDGGFVWLGSSALPEVVQDCWADYLPVRPMARLTDKEGNLLGDADEEVIES